MKKQNRLKKILLKLGGALAFVGAFVGILSIPSKAAEIPLSLLDIKNMKQVTMYAYNSPTQRWHETIVKDGIFGSCGALDWELNLNDFQTSSYIQEVANEKIYSPYGLFYNTPWSIYTYFNEEGLYIAFEQDMISFLECEFVVPVTINNMYFENRNFDRIECLNTNNDTIGFITDEAISLNNVAKIRCISDTSDYADEPYWLATGVSTASYSQGYIDGRNAANNIINNLQSENNTLQNINENLQTEVSSLQSQLQNVNGSWQSVFFTMVDIPFLTMSNVLNFDLFGLNLYRALIGMLTILAIFFLFRKLSGK